MVRLVPIPVGSAQAIALSAAEFKAWAASLAWGTIVLVVLCFAAAPMRDLAWRVAGDRPFLKTALFGLMLGAAFGVLLLTGEWVRFQFLRDFGMTSASVGDWLLGQGRRIGGYAALGSALLWFPYALLRRTGRFAWVIAWIGLALGTIGAQFLPDDRPPPAAGKVDPALYAKVQDLAHRAGIAEVRLEVVPRAQESAPLTMEVSGSAAQTRINLGESALERMNERQLLAGLAHEMGHIPQKWNDVVRSVLGLLIALAFAQYMGTWLIQRYGPRLHIRALDDVASAPVLIALYLAVSVLLEPAEMAMLRAEEAQADEFALRLTGDGQALAEVLLITQQGRQIDPRPPAWILVLRRSHPPLAERVEAANAYRK